MPAVLRNLGDGDSLLRRNKKDIYRFNVPKM